MLNQDALGEVKIIFLLISFNHAYGSTHRVRKQNVENELAASVASVCSLIQENQLSCN